MTAMTRSASITPSSMSLASSEASLTLCRGTLRTSIGAGTGFLPGSDQWVRTVPPASRKRSAASTLGPMLPRANWPAAACSRSSAAVTRPSGRADGVPKSTITWGTSVAMTRVSASTSRARIAAVRSLSMTASTPRRAGPSRPSWVTGMPPPPAQTTTKPAALSAWMAGESTTDRGWGEATTRRHPFSPRSSHTCPSATNRSASSRGRKRPTGFVGSRKPGSSASTSVRVTRPAVRWGRPRASSAASSSSARVKAIVAWVCATFQSSGTGGTTWAAISFLTSRLPTWGPLPWVSTTSTPAATTSATWPAASRMASRCAAGVADPSGPVIALPPRAITTRRDVTQRTLAGFLLAVKYSSGGEWPGSTAPEVEQVAAGTETGRLHDVDRQVELLADRRRGVGVAAEADRLAALLVEPAHLVGRGQRARRVHLERPARAGQGPEHRPVLLLEVLLDVPVVPAGPVAAREVHVREHLEDVALLDHLDERSQVAAHRGVGVGVEQPADPDQMTVEIERVQRAEDPVDGGVAQVRRHAGREEVRLTGLHTRPDPQPGKALPDLGQLGEVALDVDRQLVRRVPAEQPVGGRPVVVQPVGEVQVLGEGDRGEPERDRPLAGPAHGGRRRGVP